jgi:Bacterial Ig-like domain (group 2)
MIRKWLGVITLIVTATTLLSLSSCARDQKLQGITVTPNTATFGGVGAQIQFKAVGSYIHPPENKDITAKVTWSIDSQNLVTIDAPGLVTAINDCGTGNVMAAFQEGGNYVFGTAFVAAAGVGTSACTQATLTVALTGTGTVTSSPAGIICPGTCTAGFGLDQTVVLTGTPTAPATSVTWGADCTPNGNTCSVSLNTNETVTATFQ